jgi:hypothetical protein
LASEQAKILAPGPPPSVEVEPRAKGVRVTLVRQAEINAQGNAYLDAHPELYVEARERAKLIKSPASPFLAAAPEPRMQLRA